MARPTSHIAPRRRILAVGLIVGMTAALLSLVVAAPPAHADTTGNALKRWAATMSGPGLPVSDQQAMVDAQNFDLIVANLADFSKSQVDLMHQTNSTLKVLMYLN